MLNRRLQQRVPSAFPVATATIQDYTLCYYKKGSDNSGKCTIIPREDSLVYGVVFEMNKGDKNKLDKVEGLGYGYNTEQIVVDMANGKANIYTYIASEQYIDDKLQPYIWYKQFVVAGAYQHHLPQRYITSILDVPAVKDSDRKRAKEKLNIITHTG